MKVLHALHEEIPVVSKELTLDSWSVKVLEFENEAQYIYKTQQESERGKIE